MQIPNYSDVLYGERIMGERRKYILKLIQSYYFPEKAIKEFLQAYDKIQSCDESNRIFEQQIRIYEHDIMFDYAGAFQNIKNACSISGAREETGVLVFIICLTEHLSQLYQKNNIDSALFDGIIMDIKSKNEECYMMRGVYGTFVNEWFVRFFDLTKFVLGRLQFELRYIPFDIVLDDKKIKKDTLAIGVHIPSGRPLVFEECEESFKAAYDMFLPLFDNDTVIFYCGSWLLAPDNRKLLNPDSNIVKFMDFFRVFPADTSIEHDFWRIFGKQDCSDIKKLPRDNSLRKIYAECAEKGEIPLAGRGIFYMKDRKIIH